MVNTRSTSANHGLVVQILDYLRKLRLKPGDKLPAERILADELGVGRNAAREALAVLAILRVVEIRPQSGIYLRNISAESSFENMVLLEQMGAPPSAAEILEMIEVRYPLESQAIRLACERRTEEDLAMLRKVLDEEKEALREGLNTCALDQQFHLKVIESSHNSVLLRLLNAFYQLTLNRRKAFFADRKRARESASEHERILNAIQRRDVMGATDIIGVHLQRARLYWSEALGKAKRAGRPRKAGARRRASAGR